MEKLGREPFDSSFSGEYLSARLEKRKKAIKECLLDQSVLAGIGNIYADEILFAARIHPARPANTPFLQVYGHGGESCPVCGEILCRTVIGGRSSVHCPVCQKR